MTKYLAWSISTGSRFAAPLAVLPYYEHHLVSGKRCREGACEAAAVFAKFLAAFCIGCTGGTVVFAYCIIDR